MRIVIDTNVMISGVFFPGTPSRLLQHWKSGDVSLVLSPPIFEEYREVLHRLSKKFPTIEIQPVIDLIMLEAEFMDAPKLRRKVCSDPDDDKFFACAVAAKVKVIISGDHHLLVCNGALGIKVMKPADFIANYLN